MHNRLPSLLLIGCCASLSACAHGNKQIVQMQQEKEQLTEVIRSQRETNTALKDKADTLAKRVDEAEKELAVAQGRGTRISRSESAASFSSPAASSGDNLIREPSAAATKSPPEEKLPWRPARTGSLPSSSAGNR